MQTPVKTPRHTIYVVRSGHQVPPYVHGHLSNKNKCDAKSLRLITVLRFATKASGKQRLSGAKSPIQVHRHRLSQSVTNGTVFTIGASHQEGSPSPHKVSLPLHTNSEGHMTSTRLLATARLCSRELSQELIPIQVHKALSLKASHKLDMTLSIARMAGDVSLLGKHFLQLFWHPTICSNRPWGVYIAHTPQKAVGKVTDKKRYHRLNR